MELRNGDSGRCRRKTFKKGEVSQFQKDLDCKLAAAR